MSNLAKDWQEGIYTVCIEGKRVEITTIRPTKVRDPFGSYTVPKRYVVTAECHPEDEFSLSMGVALAMNRLDKELGKREKEKIKVGDMVTVKSPQLIYPNYWDWVVNHMKDKKLIAHYAFNQNIQTGGKYTVIAIAPHSVERKDTMVVYIQATTQTNLHQPCFLINIEGLKKL